MTQVERLAAFVAQASWDDLSEAARRALRARVLDALGCALGALDAGPMRALCEHTRDLGGRPLATLVGGGRTAPDRAALFNGALVRYLDFNDAYLAVGETCHPSDNLGAVLAAAEFADADGRDLLTALAVAYQVQCRLSDEAPVRRRGFDHTVQLAWSAAAGVSRVLGLDARHTAHALAIAGTALNALRVTRTGALSHWKGLAAPFAAAGATVAALLAMRGLTGPLAVVEGNKGFCETLGSDAWAGFPIDWAKEDLERVTRTSIKRFNAEFHAQSAVEGVLELRSRHGVAAGDVERVEVDVFDVAYAIIGGGEEGEKKAVATKEEADHSLPYMVAVALIDGQLLPEQYHAERIRRDDVQSLLRRVEVRPAADLTARFPAEHPCRVRLHLRGGRRLEVEKADYDGWYARPLRWEAVVTKFDRLAAEALDDRTRHDLVDAVATLEHLPVDELAALLGQARGSCRP